MHDTKIVQKLEQSYCKFCTEPMKEKDPCDQHNPKCKIKQETNWKINGQDYNFDYW